MLLLVASCVDRSLLVNTVRDYSAYNFVSKVFQTRDLSKDNKNMSVLSDHASDRIHTQSKRHPGTIGSHAGIGIHTHMIPPRTAWTSQPHRPTDFPIGHGDDLQNWHHFETVVVLSKTEYGVFPHSSHQGPKIQDETKQAYLPRPVRDPKQRRVPVARGVRRDMHGMGQITLPATTARHSINARKPRWVVL